MGYDSKILGRSILDGPAKSFFIWSQFCRSLSYLKTMESNPRNPQKQRCRQEKPINHQNRWFWGRPQTFPPKKAFLSKVSVFYTAPTAIRSLMKSGDEPVTRNDLSSLRPGVLWRLDRTIGRGDPGAANHGAIVNIGRILSPQNLGNGSIMILKKFIIRQFPCYDFFIVQFWIFEPSNSSTPENFRCYKGKACFFSPHTPPRNLTN